MYFNLLSVAIRSGCIDYGSLKILRHDTADLFLTLSLSQEMNFTLTIGVTPH